MRGFTLIETIIYLALFSVLMTGSVISLSAAEDGSQARREAASIATEAGFVEAKLEWAVRGASSISIGEGGALTLRSADDAIDPMVFSLDAGAGAIALRVGSGEAEPLTSANVRVRALTFAKVEDADGEVIGVDVAFTMDDEAFSERLYLLP